MSVNLRSLRVRLCLWYVLLSMVWMSALGIFSYIYLSHALASSREQTMQRRETRMIHFIKEEPFVTPGTPLAVQLHHFMLVSPDTDLLEVSRSDGTPIYMSPNGGGRIPWTGEACKDPCFNIVHLDRHTFRTLQHVVDLEGYPVRLTMAGVMDEHYDILKMVETSYLIFLPLMLLAAIAGCFMLSHRALEPVDRITRAARTLGIHDLHRRLPIGDTGDELQRLAEAWNELLERLERAVKGLTQLTSDVSHDLRTTITVMLATTQLALSRPRSNQEYRDSLQTIMEECQSTAALLDDLLAAARANTPQQLIECRPLELSHIIQEVCSHLLARTEMKHQQLSVSLREDLWILGDVSLIRRLVTILLDNAIKYTGEHGSIAIEVRASGTNHILEVRDTGVGIPRRRCTASSTASIASTPHATAPKAATASASLSPSGSLRPTKPPSTSKPAKQGAPSSRSASAPSRSPTQPRSHEPPRGEPDRAAQRLSFNCKTVLLMTEHLCDPGRLSNVP